MKKFLLLTLALLMILSLVACDGAPETTSELDTSIPEETTAEPEETTSEPEETTTSEPESAESTSESETPDTPAVPADPTVFTEVRETVYVINTNTLNVRASHSTDSEKVGEMKEGESVVRTGYTAEWSRILYNGEIRYASSEYLTTVAPFVYTDKPETVYIAVAQLNLREKASAAATALYVLDFGTELQRTGVSTTTDEDGNEWSRLLYNGTVCYANSAHLSTVKSTADTLTFEEKNDTVYTTAEVTVNLREDASSASTIVASLGYGTKLERTGLATAEDKDGILWSRVKFNGKICFITTTYLTTTPIATIEDADETLYVTADSLNMRSIPSLEGSVLRSLPKGSELHCTGKAAAADAEDITWYKVEFDGVTGYVSSRYLAAEKPQ